MFNVHYIGRIRKPEELPVTIADMMKKVVDEKEIRPGEGILHHKEGMDLMPSSI